MNNQKNHHENEIADVVHDGVTLKIGRHSNEEEGTDSSGDLTIEAMKEDNKDELNEGTGTEENMKEIGEEGSSVENVEEEVSTEEVKEEEGIKKTNDYDDVPNSKNYFSCSKRIHN